MAMCAAFIFFSGFLAFSSRLPFVWENKKLDRKYGTQEEVIARRTGESTGYESVHSKENYGLAFRYVPLIMLSLFTYYAAITHGSIHHMSKTLDELPNTESLYDVSISPQRNHMFTHNLAVVTEALTGSLKPIWVICYVSLITSLCSLSVILAGQRLLFVTL